MTNSGCGDHNAKQAALRQINKLMDMEEKLWAKRAKANWLTIGDRNSTFFHQYACQQ